MVENFTLEHCRKIIKHIGRLGLAGVEPEINFDLGPPVFLRSIYRNGSVKWEVLFESFAELFLYGIAENESNIERARIFRKIPREAPNEVVLEWWKKWAR